MISLLFGTWRRRLFALTVCLVSFVASLVVALSVGLMRSPTSAKSVRQLPVVGSLAVSLVEWRLGAPLDSPSPKKAVEDAPTYRKLMPLSAEEIADLIDALKKQRKAYIERVAQLRKSEERVGLYRKELTEERKQIQVLKDQVEKQWEEVRKASETLARRVTELNATEARNLKQLAATYESMKPDRAALILKDLDEATATKTLYLMRERSAAKVMEAMDQETAARLTERMMLLKQTN